MTRTITLFSFYIILNTKHRYVLIRVSAISHASSCSKFKVTSHKLIKFLEGNYQHSKTSPLLFWCNCQILPWAVLHHSTSWKHVEAKLFYQVIQNQSYSVKWMNHSFSCYRKFNCVVTMTKQKILGKLLLLIIQYSRGASFQMTTDVTSDNGSISYAGSADFPLTELFYSYLKRYSRAKKNILIFFLLQLLTSIST